MMKDGCHMFWSRKNKNKNREQQDDKEDLRTLFQDFADRTAENTPDPVQDLLADFERATFEKYKDYPSGDTPPPFSEDPANDDLTGDDPEISLSSRMHWLLSETLPHDDERKAERQIRRWLLQEREDRKNKPPPKP